MNRAQGVIAPILTLFEADDRIARDLWMSHAKGVLSERAYDLSPFRTTVEALSPSLDEPMRSLEGLRDGMKAAPGLRSGDHRWLNLRALYEYIALRAGRSFMAAGGALANPLPEPGRS